VEWGEGRRDDDDDDDDDDDNDTVIVVGYGEILQYEYYQNDNVTIILRCVSC